MKTEQHHRKQNRLKNHNYSQNGYYFATICTKNKKNYFGEIIVETSRRDVSTNRMKLSKIGEIAQRYWWKIPNHFSFVELDEFIVMPNHIHGIIVIRNSKIYVGNNDRCSLHDTNSPHTNRNMELLPKIISQYKSSVTRSIYKWGNKAFAWQKSFYDHIIHNEQSLIAIREYVTNNPNNWKEDNINNLENGYE